MAKVNSPGITGTKGIPGCGTGVNMWGGVNANSMYGKYGVAGIGDYPLKPSTFEVINIAQAIQLPSTTRDDVKYIKQKIAEAIASNIQEHVTFNIDHLDSSYFGGPDTSIIEGKISIVPEGTQTGVIYDVGVMIEGVEFTRDEVLDAVVRAHPERFI